MHTSQYQLSEKVTGAVIFTNRDCANKFYNLYMHYTPCNPTWAYIGSAIGVAVADYPSMVTMEKYNTTAKLKGVFRDQDDNPLHFIILGEE